MKRTATLLATAMFLLTALTAVAQQPEPRRPRAPMLTNEDVTSSAAAPTAPEEVITPTKTGATTIRNPRGLLESSLLKMSDVSSMRTRIQTSLPTGPREVVIESIKPNRTHVISSEGEMIIIDRNYYLKSNGTWQLTTLPAAGSQRDAGFDFRTFVKQMIGKAGVRITGQVVGEHTLDGVEAFAYEFEVTDGSESGRLQLSVGKKDGYMRRMSLSGDGVVMKISFSKINEQLSIEAPM